MPIVFKDGKLLFTEDGKLAMSADCCCKECLSVAKTVKVEIQYSWTDNQTGTLPTCEQAAASPSSRPAYLLSFRPFEGQTESLAGVGHKDMSKGDCETQTTPYLNISAQQDGYGFTITYEAVLVRAGILSVGFTPHVKFNTRTASEESDECVEVTSIDYTNELLVSTTIGGATVQTPHNPSWNQSTWLYTSPYSAAIPVRN